MKYVTTNLISLIFLIKKPIVIFQNNEDYKDLDRYKILKKKNCFFIKGSGVNIKTFYGKINIVCVKIIDTQRNN